MTLQERLQAPKYRGHMTQERAKYIWETKYMGCFRYAFPGLRGGGTVVHADGITESEDAFIMSVWDTMQGNTCYADALLRVMKGEI